jgi:nucleotide-binding universal stress UspA family protein
MSNQLSQTAGHPILVCIKPESCTSELFHEGVTLSVSLRRPLHVLCLVPKARGAAGLRQVQEELCALADEARQAIPNIEVIVSVESLVGFAERRIVACAQERMARLVVVGHRHRTIKQHIHQHGTTQALVSLVEVPLLIVPLAR